MVIKFGQFDPMELNIKFLAKFLPKFVNQVESEVEKTYENNSLSTRDDIDGLNFDFEGWIVVKREQSKDKINKKQTS